MRQLFLLSFLSLTLWAQVHYAKVEPYRHVVLKSAVSGMVVEVDLAAEGTMVRKGRVVQIDDALDRVDLNDTRRSIMLLEEMVTINREIADSLAQTVRRQKGYYERIAKLSTASKTQKDNAYNAYASAKTQYLGVKEKIISLKKQLLDMRYKAARLEDTIAKKALIVDNQFLYKLMVREGDFVAPGTPLAEVEDMQKAKLVLYLEPEELADIEKKSVYLNDIKTRYRVDKVWRTTDERYISSYRAEIYIPAPKGKFSELIKVEIK